MPTLSPPKRLEAIYPPIHAELAQVERALHEALRRVGGALGAMTHYVSEMLGKRLRPALALFGAQAAAAAGGGVDPRVVRMAAAVELIHTATLIHDDVIDDAALRRGTATVNARWGNTLSVLAGDYLYAQAFCVLSTLGAPEVLRLMAETSQRVCAGEVTQVRHQFDPDLDEATYLTIIREKTASLMAAAAQGAALLVGAAPARVQALGRFGQAFGMAFQIVDDTHDLVGDEARLGKSLGTDLAQGQLTLPLIALRDTGDPAARALLAEWLKRRGVDGHGEAAQIKTLALTHRVAETCFAKAQAFADEARAALATLPPAPARQGLADLTDYILAP